MLQLQLDNDGHYLDSPSFPHDEEERSLALDLTSHLILSLIQLRMEFY